MSHPDSLFTHKICEDCWNENFNRIPVRLKDFELTTCCFCGALRNIDIYVRSDSDELKCEEAGQ